MRAITDAERALLLGHRVDVTAGMEVLDADLNLLEDASDTLRGGRVYRNMDGRIHGTCKLEVSRVLPWATGLVRVFVTLANATTSARFDVGVFVLVTPERPVGETPATYSVQGYDRMYLLEKEVGDSYSAEGGVVEAIRSAFVDAGLTGYHIDSTAEAAVLPQAMVWPLVASEEGPTTWLRVINDLAATINYRGVWVDETGHFRSGPYAEPSSRPVEFTFEADSTTRTIILPQRTVIEDHWRQPNRWVFVQQNRTTEAIEGDGIYIVDHSDGSQLLGGTWTRQTAVDVANQAALEATGDRMVAASLRRSTFVKFTAGPFPVAGHADVYRLIDTEAIGDRKVQAADWELDLRTALTQFTVEVVS